MHDRCPDEETLTEFEELLMKPLDPRMAAAEQAVARMVAGL